MKANKETLYRHVDVLTAIRPFRNYRNLGALKETADYIRNEFTHYGYTPSSQFWTPDEYGFEYENVIAVYQPEKEHRLIVGAHYDVCGNQPGADDNASAVAGLLETARMVAEAQPNLDFRIDFVAYNLEEPPFFATSDMGSYVHAKSLHEQNASVIGMICYEMIGYFSDEPGSQDIPIPALNGLIPTTGNFIIVLGLTPQAPFANTLSGAMKKNAKVRVEPIIFPFENELTGLSDHRSYWKFGYNAVMINDTSFLRNPHYHEESDTIETLDFDRMSEVVAGVYHGVLALNENFSEIL